MNGIIKIKLKIILQIILLFLDLHGLILRSSPLHPTNEVESSTFVFKRGNHICEKNNHLMCHPCRFGYPSYQHQYGNSRNKNCKSEKGDFFCCGEGETTLQECVSPLLRSHNQKWQKNQTSLEHISLQQQHACQLQTMPNQELGDKWGVIKQDISKFWDNCGVVLALNENGVCNEDVFKKCFGIVQV